jgi:starch phosphorylase
MEFLLGRLLRSAIQALDLEESVSQVLDQYGRRLEDVEEEELASALGSGGLGRLAACFLDSLAALELPAWGYGLRYRFGLFRQRISDGWQSEEPDDWLRWGNPWEVPRPEEAVRVSFFGHVTVENGHEGEARYRWVDTEDVLAVPFDIPVPGFRNGTVNTLRLWSAFPLDSGLDLEVFHSGNFQGANEAQVRATVLTQVLYPAERTEAGQELRLKQQFLLASATLQDQIRRHLEVHPNLDDFADKVVLQLNDTHPAISIPELLRLLIDEYGYGWDHAWSITQKVFAYTNHTLMPEALETWPFQLLARLLPRQIQIIQEIDRRFAEHVRQVVPGDGDLVSRTALIAHDAERRVRMAHLSVVASHSVNGVAELHTKLLREGVLADFARIYPERFNCKTNGITPRRWLLQANPELAALITREIGDGWTRDLDELRKLEPLAEDAAFRAEFRAIKQRNKQALARVILAKNGIQVDPESLFDSQIKRIHEYKRQLLLAMWIVDSYLNALRDPDTLKVPRTVVVAGKAAADYTTAKLIIKLINSIANQVNGDRRLNGRLKVAFLEGYSVELAAQIVVGTEVSEQISTAGYEASGTGNMKFALNGAITLGTMDGANVEIHEEVGDENIVIFGLHADEVRAKREAGYDPRAIYEEDERIRRVVDALSGNLFCPERPGLFHPLVDSLLDKDEYMLLADLPAYIAAQETVASAYQDPEAWTKAAILNVARVGKFSSDRTIRQYAEEIWQLPPVSIPQP